jgi:hypothetical protein
MWTIFAQENLFFALNVFCGLVLLSVSWLYLDAYFALKNRRDLWKIIGFVVLGIAFMFRGLDLRNLVIFQNIDLYLRLSGYLFIIIGLIVDPLQEKPKLSAILLLSVPPLLFISPVLAVIVGLLYLRRASIGLERHLYPPAISFFLISIYELLYSLNSFRETTNLSIFNLLAPFGVIWYLQAFILFTAIAFMSKWVFKYLLKQFQSQLFMVMMGLVLSVYLIVTVSFTGLLLNNLKVQILNELESQSKVLDFALNSKKAELLLTSKLASTILRSEISNEAKADLATNDSFVVFDKDGVVTYRAEDTERVGDSLSGDVLVQRILTGNDASNIIVKDGVVAPNVMLISGSPILKDGKVEGGVLVGDLIDDAYLEGFSKLTGLRAGIYGGDILSAGGTIGIKETNQTIKEKVLISGESYSLENKWLNRSFLSVYSPIKNVEGNPVGMVYVGRAQADVLNLASKTLESIFLGTIILLILSMVPAKIIANSITKQIK